MSGPAGGREPRRVRTDRAEDRERRADRARGYRRAFRVGLAISLAAHLLLLFILGRQLQMPEMAYDETARPDTTVAPGLRVTQVQPGERGDAEPVPTPPPPVRPEPAPEEEPEEEAEDEAAEPAGDPTEEPAGEEAEPRVSNVDALTPREGDPRLWREFWDEDVARRYLGEATRADSALRAILGRYLDSLRLSEEQLREARDWTFTDGDGQRWGISPEGIHLGDVTIPLPVGQLLSPTGPRRRELEQELRDLRQIQRQEAIDEAQETRRERIEAMEDRAEEASEEASSDSTDGGGEPP